MNLNSMEDPTLANQIPEYILIVDDLLENRKRYRKIIEAKAGNRFIIIEAEGVAEALNLIALYCSFIVLVIIDYKLGPKEFGSGVVAEMVNGKKRGDYNFSRLEFMLVISAVRNDIKAIAANLLPPDRILVLDKAVCLSGIEEVLFSLE